VFVASLGLHLSDGLDFTLKNQETLVVQIDAPIAEEGCDCREVGFFSIDVVFARVVLESLSRNDEFGLGDNLMATTRLYELACDLSRDQYSYLVHNLLKVDSNLAVIQVRVLG
jgi:hypothetical protein